MSNKIPSRMRRATRVISLCVTSLLFVLLPTSLLINNELSASNDVFPDYIISPGPRGLPDEPESWTIYREAEFTVEQSRMIELIVTRIGKIEEDIGSLLDSDKNLGQNLQFMGEMTKWLVGIMAAMVVGVLAIAAGIFLNLRSAGKQKPT